jgi:hypothetical protein
MFATPHIPAVFDSSRCSQLANWHVAELRFTLFLLAHDVFLVHLLQWGQNIFEVAFEFFFPYDFYILLL